MTQTLTIQKSIVVKRPADAAFRAFVDEIDRWWPLQEGYTFGKGRAKEIILEGRVGGRLFERFTDGEEYVVGKVTAYQPPSRVVFTWQDHAWPGATEVEIRFTPEGSGTRVDLEHRGWEQIGAVGAEWSPRYGGGWEGVLEAYVRYARVSQ